MTEEPTTTTTASDVSLRDGRLVFYEDHVAQVDRVLAILPDLVSRVRTA